MQNGSLVVKYYDTITNLPYTGPVEIVCDNNLTAVVRKFVGVAAEDEFAIPEMANIVVDESNNKKMIWATRSGGFELIEDASDLYGFTFINSTTIQLTYPLDSGEELNIKFFTK